jgi:hypothetical protein
LTASQDCWYQVGLHWSLVTKLIFFWHQLEESEVGVSTYSLKGTMSEEGVELLQVGLEQVPDLQPW